MKRIILYFVLLIETAFVNYSIAQDFDQDFNFHHRKINIDQPTDYLPEYLNGIYIGMPLADFAEVKDTLFLKTFISKPLQWIGYREEVIDDQIHDIFYKFDSVPDSINETEPLFQITIKFINLEQADRYVETKFHEPLVKEIPTYKQWILKTNKNFVLIVTQRNDEVKLTGTIPGSEWDPND